MNPQYLAQQPQQQYGPPSGPGFGPAMSGFPPVPHGAPRPSPSITPGGYQPSIGPLTAGMQASDGIHPLGPGEPIGKHPHGPGGMPTLGRPGPGGMPPPGPQRMGPPLQGPLPPNITPFSGQIQPVPGMSAGAVSGLQLEHSGSDVINGPGNPIPSGGKSDVCDFFSTCELLSNRGNPTIFTRSLHRQFFV